MGNTLRILGAAALLVALAPLAFAQNATTSTAADVATAVYTSSEAQPLPTVALRGGALYTNGPLFNSPGTGAGGLNESILQVNETLFGWGAQGDPAIDNEVADDFTVPAGESWNVTGVTNFTYQSFAGNVVTITGANSTIYADAGGSPGAAVCSGTFVGASLTDTYRVSVSGNADRRIQQVNIDYSGCTLGSGVYWLGMQYVGNAGFSGPWQPPVPQPLGASTCEDPNGFGVQQSITGGPFALALNGTCESDAPFEILGSQVVEGVTISATASSTTVPQGGSITFNYVITNNTAASATGDLFFRAIRGGTTVAQGVIINDGTLGAGQQFTGSFTQQVPGNAPPGTYSYRLAIGSFPNVIVDSEDFSITVTSPDRIAGSPTTEWAVADVTPWSASAVATTAATLVASPNPFAGQTALRFTLEEASEVRLAVYDLLGREVALLVDGAVEAGTHTARFDARALAAGTYVYRLVAGEQVQTGRLTLAH